MAHSINGKAIAADIRREIAEKAQVLREQKGIVPGLGLLLVGEDPASQVYVRSKAKACEEVGFHSVIVRKPADTTEQEILEQIRQWNANDAIHGILVQLPLPRHVDETRVLLAIAPDKDVDGFHPDNVGRLVTGLPGFVPCTPAGIVELLVRSGIETKGKHAVVVGRSNIVGKPIANLLYQKNSHANAIVTLCHTAAPDISVYTKQADILISAVGVPNLIGADDVKEGVVVIDVGINRVEDTSVEKGYRLVGDVDFAAVEPKASAITPVPGGVGPMTIAMLLHNTLRSANGEARKA